MDAGGVTSLHRYDQWATERVLGACDGLTTEQLQQDVDAPWGSIRNQFVHQFSVHRSWLSWVDGSLSGEEAYALTADPAAYPDLASLREFWGEILTQTNRFLARATNADLERILAVEFPGSEFSMPAGEIMVHLAHHSMQHRTESTVALTRLGQSPGDIDYLFYALEQARTSSEA